jgi:2,4-dienoyl-CoA reductase (NADPH2)
MARSLIANPQLPRQYENEPGRELPDKPCTHCNRCVGRTGTSPLGCYDVSRFQGSEREMARQLMEWNRPDRVASEAAPHAYGVAAIRRASGSAG